MRPLQQLILVLTSCVVGQVQSVHAAGTEDWVKQNLVNHERLLCQRNMSGEHFFLASAGDNVKVGSRLDMTGYSAAHSFTIAWTFQNERDASVVAKISPKTVKQSYTKSDSKVFAENIEYQTLVIGPAQTVRVVVHISKCERADCDKQLNASKGDKEYKVELCVVQASALGIR
jgi:hypothetical protein